MTRIIIDSTIDLPEQYRRQVHIVPLTIHFGTEELLDGVDIDRQRFYERLVESDVLPTTSQPSPDAFAQLFDQVEAAGDSAVVLTISHKLSGTYQSACIAAEGRERIFVVDTMSASIGSGILARYAIDNAHLPAGELAALLERRRQDVCIIGLVDTLEYLKKGGRISKTAAFAGGLLNIHPVLTLTDGEVTIIGKARGSRQGNNLLVQKIHESGGHAPAAGLFRAQRRPAAKVCGRQRPSVGKRHGGAGVRVHRQRHRHPRRSRCRGGGLLPAGRKIIGKPRPPH